jgi:hypothetical protein
MNNWCISGFSRIFLLGILIFKGLTARRIYKSFGVKGLIIYTESQICEHCVSQTCNLWAAFDTPTARFHRWTVKCHLTVLLLTVL